MSTPISLRTLYKGSEVADTDHPGHRVQIFKQENLALRAAMMRVRRLLDNYETTEDPEMIQEIHKGLLRQLGLVSQLIGITAARKS